MDKIKRPVIIVVALNVFEIINGFEEQIETHETCQE
jgi:hypothetical protein